jgi:hypothetical protein
MRKLLFASLLLLAAACTTKTKDFIAGVYVNHAESTYSVADDTLIITSNYRVTRRTTYHRTGGQPQRLVKQFTGVWDENKQVLTLTQTGTLLLFRPAENALLLGNSTYRKL